MILIADGGATKTHWVLFDDTRMFSIETIGISPVHCTPMDHYDELQQQFEQEFPGTPDQVFFYGAGCASENLCANVASLLQALYPHAEVHVDSDMLGAARAVLGTKPGIACILGTGSNSCLYNGSEITDQVPALGYILGDEGSGAILGREVLNRYFKRDMPEKLREKFAAQYESDLSVVLPKIYQQGRPSRYLAGFSRFIIDNLDDAYIYQVAKEVFNDFFYRNIKQYPNAAHYPVGFAGSVAWYYKNILIETASDHGFKTGDIVQSPMQGLINYHSLKIQKQH